jgi:hypothetical protein
LASTACATSSSAASANASHAVSICLGITSLPSRSASAMAGELMARWRSSVIAPSKRSPRKAACRAAAAAITSRWRARLIAPSAGRSAAERSRMRMRQPSPSGSTATMPVSIVAGRRCRKPARHSSAVMARPPATRPSQSPPGTTRLAIPGLPSGSVTRSSSAPLLPAPRLAGAMA